MSNLDIIITLFITFWSLYGFFRGFVSELISIICWSSAIYFSSNYFYLPANFIDEYINSEQISSVLAFLVIFISTFIISAILGFIFSKFINVVGLGSFNKFLGLFFGFLKGMVFMLIIIYILNLTEFRENIIFQESKYLSLFDAIIDKYLTSSKNFFDDINLKI
tara:strand:+ start:101 stop:592 length:492 start_codon:yes stop_codon:yes gene_type:complete